MHYNYIITYSQLFLTNKIIQITASNPEMIANIFKAFTIILFELNEISVKLCILRTL